MKQPLYVFDMDETLVNGDCAMLWNAFMVEKEIVSDPDFIATDKTMMALYARGQMDMEEYLSYTLKPLTTIPCDDIDRLVDEFVIAKVLPLVFPDALRLIKTLKSKQLPLLIISATVSFIVQKVAKHLGIDQAIGIDLLLNNGCYSNVVEGVPSYREGKITRLKTWIDESSIDFSEITFYTDSINDLPLCEYADHVYLINPCEQLLNKAQEHKDWTIYHWR